MNRCSPLAVQTPIGRVEDGARALTPSAAPSPTPAHQTGRANCPHPVFRLASPPDSRTRRHPDTAQLDNAQTAVDRIPREAGIATRLHLMTSSKIMTYAVVDVIVDRLIRLR